MKILPSRKRLFSKKGFTLIEIMIVIMIIVGLLAMSFQSADVGKGDLNGALRITIAMMERARTVAQLNPRQDDSTKPSALLLIHNDETEARNDLRKGITRGGEFRYMRYMTVIYWYEDANTGQSGWKVSDSGAYLPQGVYFVFRQAAEGMKKYSGFGNNSGLDSIRFDINSDRLQSGGNGPRWVAYSFKGTGESMNVGGRLLLGAGSYNPNDKRVVFPNEYALGGFYIFPWTVRVYDRPDQISGTN